MLSLSTQVTGTLPVGNGGTGTSTTPTYGKLLVGNASGGYDIIAIGWQADYADPSNFINVLLDGRQIPDEGSSNNAAYFNSPKFNSLMDKADALSGPARFKAYGRLDLQIMKEGAPWAPIINSTNRRFFSARISNVIYNEASTSTALNALVIK